MTLIWPSPAKLNLFLYITGRRANGYHELQTMFQFLNYGDEITIQPRTDNKIKLLTPFVNLLVENNLIMKAAHLLRSYCYKIQRTKNIQGTNIYVKKILPIGSGLGGSSSNAATILIALNYYWKTNLDDNILAKLARQLGADVPVFVKGHAAFAESIGDQLLPTEPAEKWYLVVHPGIMISTKEIFADPLLSFSEKRSLRVLLQIPYTNDLESIVIKRFPQVKKLILWLLEEDTPSRLTGTGACVFAEFETETSALQVLNKAPKWVHGFVAKGINYSPLHKFRLGLDLHLIK